MVRSFLVGVKKEMDEKGLTFDELLGLYEEAIKVMERRSNP
jgi:hypothetical protein